VGRRTTNTPGGIQASTYVNGAVTVGLAAVQPSVTMTAPASIVSGNTLVAFVNSAGATGATTGPSGWTKKAEATDFTISVWTKTATGAEPGTYQWTFSGTGFGCGAILQYHPFSTGGTDGTPLCTVQASGTSFTIPSVTPTRNNDVWVSCVVGLTSGHTPATPAGLTLRDNGVLASHQSVYTFEQQRTDTSATGTATANWTGGSTFYSAVSALLQP
jgi:hypothetical protein